MRQRTVKPLQGISGRIEKIPGSLFPLALLLLSIVSPIAHASDWDMPELDTARNVSYLADVEKDVILEINKVRTDPKKYAEEVMCTLDLAFDYSEE